MKRQMIALSLLVMWAQTAPAFAADVTVVTAYPGNKGPGWKQTIDVAGAVGPRHVVDFDEGGFVVHDKTTGRELKRFSTREFWRNVEPANSRPGILWYEVRISDGALLQEGFVDDPKCDYLHPSLAVDSRGNLGLGCTRTSETEFPSVYVMMHAATDPANTMRGPLLAMPGTTYYRYSGIAAINLSHYSSTCIDPSNPDLLWTYQAYGNSTLDKQWCTAWAAFSLSSAPAKP
jgi:hypothetical protein